MPAMELPRELAAVPIDVLKVRPVTTVRLRLCCESLVIELTSRALQAFISDVLIQVLQALYPRADLRPNRVLNEINILLPQTIARPGLFSGAAGSCSALSATTYQATTPKPALLFQHDCL